MDLQRAIDRLRDKIEERKTIRALPELKKNTFAPDKERLEDLPGSPKPIELLDSLQSKFGFGAKDKTDNVGFDEIEGGKMLGNILRACQNARFTYDVLILHAFRIFKSLNWDSLEKQFKETDWTDMEKKMNLLGCEGPLELTYDVSRRLKRIEDITTWKIEILSSLDDNTSRRGTAVTPAEKLCAVPFLKNRWAIIYAKVPKIGSSLSVPDARNHFAWKAVAPCLIRDVKKVVDGKDVTLKEKTICKKTEQLITEIWSDPARGCFKGSRAIWHHVQAQNILGISEDDVHQFLKKQEVSQRAKMPNTRGVYSPIITENIGHVQMDLIVVKFNDVRVGKRAQQSIDIEGGGCEIACRRVTRAIAGSDKEIVIKEISHNDVVKIDFDIGKNSTKYVYILTIIDLFSKFVWAFPLIRKSAGHVVACLENLWLTEGSPRIFQSDNGTEFVNDEIGALSARFNVERRLCRPYNSQCNGAIERLNRTIQTALSRALYTYRSNNWHELLPLIIYAYNTTRHTTTKLSPFLTHRGREPAPLGNVLLRPTKKEREEREEEKEEEPEVAPPRKLLKRKAKLGGGELDKVLVNIDNEHKIEEENISKKSREERYHSTEVFQRALLPLDKLIVEIEGDDEKGGGKTFRMINNEVVQMSDEEEEDVTQREQTAQLLATNEARRAYVHDRIRTRANLMVAKSIEKFGQLKAVGILKTDVYEEPLEDGFSSLGARISEGQRVRLSLLYFSQYRRENKSPFKRGSVAASLWSEYTFRVVAQKNLMPITTEAYIPEYWIRLEDAQEVDESEAKAMQQKGGTLVVLAQRQQLFPIPDETIKIPNNEIFTFASRVPRQDPITRDIINRRLRNAESSPSCVIKTTA